jgi:hypothetical protein
VFEGLNIRAKHGAEKTFHGAPDTKIVEELRENYNARAFFTQLFLNQITKMRPPQGARR